MLVISALTFGDPIHESFIFYGFAVQAFCMSLCVLSYICAPFYKRSNLLLLMFLYFLCSTVADMLFTEVSALYYHFEALIFTLWAFFLVTRHEPKTSRTIDYDNILLIFYIGNKGSFIMRFFGLFGFFQVRSISVSAGDTALTLKSNKTVFTIIDSNVLLKNSQDYIIVDTGVKHSPKFIEKMKTYTNIKAKKFGLRTRCIEAIAPLLSSIGLDFKPKSVFHTIPSVYLGQVV